MFKYVSICNNYIPTILLINVWWLSSLPCGISSRVQTPARTFEFSCGILCKWLYCLMFTVTYCKGQQWGIQLVLVLVVMVV